MRAFLALSLVVVAFGCESVEDGADGKDVALTDLPIGSRECASGGVRVSVGAEDHFVCNGQAGANGEAGASGAAGANGSGGQASVPFRPELIAACNTITTLPSGTSAQLSYKTVTFSDGSVFVSCSASTTGVTSAGSSEWFAPWQVGAPAQACLLVSDASGAATGGWWEFKQLNGKYRAIYHDISTADDGAFYEFKTADCPTARQP